MICFKKRKESRLKVATTNTSPHRGTQNAIAHMVLTRSPLLHQAGTVTLGKPLLLFCKIRTVTESASQFLQKQCGYCCKTEGATSECWLVGPGSEPAVTGSEGAGHAGVTPHLCAWGRVLFHNRNVECRCPYQALALEAGTRVPSTVGGAVLTHAGDLQEEMLGEAASPTPLPHPFCQRVAGHPVRAPSCHRRDSLSSKSDAKVNSPQRSLQKPRAGRGGWRCGDKAFALP